MKDNPLLSKIIANIEQGKDKAAIIYHDMTYSYHDLHGRINELQIRLEQLKVKRKSRVVIKIENSLEFIVILLALWQLDCIPVPLSSKTGFQEFINAVKESKANGIITKESCMEFEEEKVLLSDGLFYYNIGSEDEDITEEAAIFFYTTGTTGDPKCVMFNQEAFYYNIADLAQAIQLSNNDIVYTPLSPDLTASLTTAVLPSLYIGATLVLSPKQLPRSIFNYIKTYRVTIFFAVPYIYELLVESNWDKGSWEKSSLRLCLSSSAYLSKTLITKYYELTGRYIRSIYCSSEAGVISYNGSEDENTILESVGTCIGDTEVYLLFKNMAEHEENSGELYVKGNHIAMGYFGRLDLQKKVFTDEGVKTGDIGFIKKDGSIRLLGRVSCTINVGGHLVYPNEVEAVILEIEGIVDALVYGIKDTTIGELVAAKVVADSKKCTTKQIMSHCMSRLSSYKIPRLIEFVENLEKGNYGKKKRVKVEEV